jgi:hypothetical protein
VLGVVELPPEQVKFVIGPVQPAMQPPALLLSQTSFPTTLPSPQTGRQRAPLGENPVWHTQVEAVVGFPPEQVKLALEPEQAPVQPPAPLSSQTSVPATSPSPQLGKQFNPLMKNPG